MIRITKLAILLSVLGLAGCGGNDPSSESAVPAVAAAAPLVTLAEPVHQSQSAAPAPATQAATGTATDASGELLVLQEDDFATGKGRTRHFLKTAEGRLELNFAGTAPELRSGMRYVAHGLRNGNTVTVTPGADEGGGAAAELTVPMLGERKTLVLLVNFQDNASQPYSLTEATNIVFTQASNFFKENSQQQVWLAGAAHGWYTLPLSQTTCDVFQIENAAKQAATSAGVNVSAYNHYVYVFPNTTACAWGGLGTIGGNPGSVWINGNLKVASVSHELGHNLGLQHSHGQECGASAIATSCTNVDYGDGLDVMGSTNPGHLNAFQKERLGWLNYGGLPPITTVQTSGSYTLTNYEAANTSAKALKILKSTNPTTGAKTWYYVEYRTPTGSDSFISTINNTNVPNGVVVHTGVDGGGSYLLDMTPASSVYNSYDWNDPALPVGQSFSDAAAGVTITTISVNGSSATVNINIGAVQADCGRAAPVLTPATQSISGNAGSAVTYTVTVKNMDAAACGASSFAMQAAPAAGWSASFGSGTLSIAPGATASTSMTVTSPATASGSSVVGITAINNAAPAKSGSASATYQVASALQATVATDKASYAAGQTVYMSSTVKSGTAAVSGAPVSFAVVQPNGSVVTVNAATNASGVASATYKIGRKGAAGAYRVNITATGGAQSVAASAGFSVQ